MVRFNRLTDNGTRLSSMPIHGNKMQRVLNNLLASIHESRRLRAKHVIRQYRHLIAEDCASLNFRTRTRRNLDMAITDSSNARRPSPPFKAWPVAVLAGFGISHVVGGYILHHAPGIRPIN